MTDLTPKTQAALHLVVALRQSKQRVPGMLGAVIRNGELAWSTGIGSADLERAGEQPDDDTQFLIGSVSKTFTAVLVMALRDEGRLDLDDPLEKHVPESRHVGITIRQMLSHASGMQREPVGDVWDTLRYPDRRELVTGWGEAERILRPHHRWHYSNLVYSLLGEVVARLDERDWFESLQFRILEPLGMKRTTLGLTGDHAMGYHVPRFTDVPVREPVLDIGALAPATGLAGTARDLAAWAAFLADPSDDVLDPDTVDEMCQPQIITDLDGWEEAWGLGLTLVRHEGRVFVGHTGGMPGHTTGLFVHRPSSTGGIALMNATSAPDPAGLAMELATYVLENEPGEPEVWVPGSKVPDELMGVVGRWFSAGQAIEFSVRQGILEARPEAAPEDRPPSVFTQVDEDVYRTQSGRETGELLRITRDSEGGVAVMHWASYRFTREPYAFGEWL